MTSEGLGEMFEGAGKFPLVSMGGRAEGLACADPVARTPIDASENFLLVDILVDVQNVIFIYLFPYFWNPVKNIRMSWESFLTMSIATERFLAVCSPLLYRRHKFCYSSFIHLLT